MPSIEGSGYPLVFQVPDGTSTTPQADQPNSLSVPSLNVRAYVRAFGGMQKEAVVALSTGETWRLVSDEGPYLNGTDLAPFPLGHFQAGMQFSLMAEILKHAKAESITLKAIEFSQVNGYSMDGSALRGTMTGGAIPVEVQINIEADADEATIGSIIRKAEQSSPAHALMRDLLENTFALRYNNQVLDLPDLTASSIASPDSSDLAAMYAKVQPDEAANFMADIITKQEAAEVIHGVEGGASSSLQESQKRQLHVMGTSRWLGGTLMEATTQVVKPIGSLFRFLCDVGDGETGGAKTPPPLAYLSAGVGFCYMTQLGRYAHIKKYHLESYQIIQDNSYIEGNGDTPGSSSIFDTHVYLDADETDSEAQKTVTMGEQTCFLHAAMRDIFPTNIAAQLNGEAIKIPS
ncbi:MAG: OsmC family protein [Chloroflexota bacterium]